MLITPAMPVFLCVTLWAAVLFPEKVRTFANGLLQARFRFRMAGQVIAVGCHLAAAVDVHSGAQGPEFSVGDQSAMRGRLQAFAM
jgi:hypothetical protein